MGRGIWIWMVGIPILISTPYGHDSDGLCQYRCGCSGDRTCDGLFSRLVVAFQSLLHNKGWVCCCCCNSGDMICNMVIKLKSSIWRIASTMLWIRRCTDYVGLRV